MYKSIKTSEKEQNIKRGENIIEFIWRLKHYKAFGCG